MPNTINHNAAFHLQILDEINVYVSEVIRFYQF